MGLALLLTTACLEAETETCGDSHLCPASLACFEGGGGTPQCVRPELLAACTGDSDILVCRPASGGEGACINGLCVISTCGNCKIEGNEVCDDGNNDSGDGCRSDCLAATWEPSRRDLGTETILDNPRAMAADEVGNLYIADQHRLRKVDGSGVVTTLVGSAAAGFSGDDGPADAAALNSPHGVAVAPSGNLYIADSASHRLRTVDASSVITTLAGATAADCNLLDPDTCEGFGDGASALYRQPSGLFHEASSQTLYVADTGNHVVRLFDLSSGLASTFVGTPQVRGVDLLDLNSDGQISADEVPLYLPRAVVRCPSGDWYIADTGNNRVLRVAATNCEPSRPETCVVSAILGDTEPASSGEGFPSDIFPVHSPQGLYCDSQNNLFVTSTTTVRLLSSRDHDLDPATPPVVDGRGNVQSILGAGVLNPEEFPCPSLGPLLDGPVSGLTGIAGVDDNTVWVTDSCTGTLLELTRPTPESAVCN